MAQKQEWMIILPDHEGALEKRMAVRADHLKNTKPLVESGFMVLGGAMLEEPTAEGKPLKINGSILMAAADTREQVLERLKEDVYYKGDVWDKEKASEVQRAHVGRAWSKDDVG